MATATKAKSHPEVGNSSLSAVEEFELNRRHWDAYETCEYNQQLHRVLALLNATHKEVETLVEMDGERTVRKAWRKAGLSGKGTGSWGEQTFLDITDLNRDARGFLWVLKLFHDFCDQHCVGEAIESAASC